MSDLTKQQFDKWLHEIVAESTDGQRIQRRDCMTVDQECMAFEGWKASRECLVIELPKEENYVQSSETAMFFLLEDVRESINSAGVKTK